MKMIIQVGESVVAADLDHFIELVRDAKTDGPSVREMIDEEVGSMFFGALNAEWLRVSEEVKMAHALIGSMK